MDLSYLYNLDESRTAASTIFETITVPTVSEDYTDSVIRVSLKHIPLKDTLVVNDGDVSVLTDGTMPSDTNSVAIDYREEYDYVAAKGVIIFSVAAAGTSYNVKYIPAASRVDATCINELVRVSRFVKGMETDDDLTDKATFNVWSKYELVSGENENIVAWNSILDRPREVSASVSALGLMSSADKAKLDAMGDSFKVFPIASINAGSTQIAPTSWGGSINIPSTNSIIVSGSGDTLSLNVDTDFVLTAVNPYLMALRGTSGTPSDSNRYVTNDDYRMTNRRDPNAHKHEISDVTGLESELLGKAEKQHSHTLADIKKDINNCVSVSDLKGDKGDKGDAGTIEVGTVTTGDPGTNASISNTGTASSAVLNFVIPRGDKGEKGDQGEKLSFSDLTDEEKESLRGPQGIVPDNYITTDELYGTWTQTGFNITNNGDSLNMSGGTLYFDSARHTATQVEANSKISGVSVDRVLVKTNSLSSYIYTNGNLTGLSVGDVIKLSNFNSGTATFTVSVNDTDYPGISFGVNMPEGSGLGIVFYNSIDFAFNYLNEAEPSFEVQATGYWDIIYLSDSSVVCFGIGSASKNYAALSTRVAELCSGYLLGIVSLVAINTYEYDEEGTATVTGTETQVGVITDTQERSPQLINKNAPSTSLSTVFETLRLYESSWYQNDDGFYVYDYYTTKLPMSLPFKKYTDVSNTSYYEMVMANVRAYINDVDSFIRIISSEAFDGVLFIA